MGRWGHVGKVAGGILLAILVFSLLGKISPFSLSLFNPFSWIVLYFSLVRHEVFGSVVGTLCGLLQDAFSYGVFGVGGLTKTLLGFSAGLIARKINVLPPGRNFLFLFLMAAAELAVWKAMVIFLLGEKSSFGGSWIFLQPLVTALVVSVAFQILGRKKEGGD
ncbi:MAG: rod shape-determining protein MreD [Candidatus Aminicenantales bacterium]